MTVVSGVATSQGQEFDSSNRRIRTREFPKGRMLSSTLPETNMAPENNPLEKEIPIGNHRFRGYVSFRECNIDRPFRK